MFSEQGSATLIYAIQTNIKLWSGRMNCLPYHLSEEEHSSPKQKHKNGKLRFVIPAPLKAGVCRAMFSTSNAGCTTADQPSRAALHVCLWLPTDTDVHTSVAVAEVTSCHTSMRTEILPGYDKRCQGNVRNRRCLRRPPVWSTVGLVAS
jgi:hypothetical protein